MPRDFQVAADLGGNKITSLGTPTAATDAATKGYVDTVTGGGPTFATNLSTNPSFEGATPGSSWTASDFTTGATLTATYGAQDGGSVAGVNAAKLVNTASAQDDYIEQQITGLTPGATYRISAHYRTTAFTAGAISNRGLFAYETATPANSQVATITAAQSSWLRLSVTLTLGSGTALGVRLYAPQGTIFWDAVQVTAGATLEVYFDGDTPAVGNASYSWTGTQHYSRSTRTINGIGAASCRVFNNATQSHATSGAEQIVAFNSERYDTAAMHDNATNNSRITIPTTGIYAVGATLRWASNATGVRYVRIRRNGTTNIGTQLSNAANGIVTILTVNIQTRLTAGDYLEVISFQNSGAALNLEYIGGANNEESGEFWAACLLRQ